MVFMEIIIIMLLVAAITAIVVKKRSNIEKIDITKEEGSIMREEYHEQKNFVNPPQNLDYRETLKELSNLLEYIKGVYNKNVHDVENIQLIEEAIFEIEKQRGFPPIELILDIEGMIENLVNFYDLRGVK